MSFANSLSLGANPARVSLMSIPSKEVSALVSLSEWALIRSLENSHVLIRSKVVRTRNLFNVTDARLHWQSNASYLCVKVGLG